MKRIILETALLILLSTLLGIGSAGLRRPPVPMRLPDDFFVPESGARLILLAHGVGLMEEGGVLFVDVRPEEAFIHGHIPGALSIPAENYPDLAANAADWLYGVPLVLYGASGNVNEADNLAARLMEDGFGPVSILVEGYEAWVEAGLSVDSGRDGILDTDPWDEDDDSWHEEGAWDDDDGPWDDHDDLRDEEGVFLHEAENSRDANDGLSGHHTGNMQSLSALMPCGGRDTP